MEGTPFTLAIKEGNQSIITELQLQNIHPTTEDYNQLCNIGNYVILKSFVESYGMKADSVGFTYACKNGYIDIIQLLLQNNIYPSTDSFESAIINHQFLILQYLFSLGYTPTSRMLYLACVTNQLYLMFYFNKLGVKFTPEIVDSIIPGNFLKNLQFAYSYDGRASDSGFYNACELGYESIIDFLLTQEFTMNSQAGLYLLSGGHIDLFYKYNPTLSYDMWIMAIELEDETLIEWLYDNGLVPDEDVLNYAMFYGLSNTVYFLINIGILPTSTTIKMGQISGHVQLTDELIRIYDFNVISTMETGINIIDEKGQLINPSKIDPDEILS